MAGKISAPNAAIFTSDPMEQIFGKGVLDRDMSGLSNMFLTAFGMRRQAGQDAYMAGLEGANRLALQEAAQEERMKMLIESLKQGTELAKVGYQPSNMPIMNTLFSDNSIGGSSDTMAKLLQAYKQAQINKLNAEGSGAGGDQVTVKTDVGPGGAGFSTYTVKGRNATSAADTNNALVAARLKQLGLQPGATDAVNANKMLERRSYGAQ